MVPESIKNRIVQDTSIVEVIGEYVKLEKAGSSFKGICPFHDDHDPSMSVSEEKKFFKCFVCEAKGNVISFVSKYEKISIDQAAIKLGKRIGLVVNENISKEEERLNKLYEMMDAATEFYQFYLKNTEEGLIALDYLHKRGISDEIIDEFKIGLSPDLPDSLSKFLTKKNYSNLNQIDAGLVRSSDNGNIDVFRHRIMFPLSNEHGRTVGYSGRIYYESNLPKYSNSPDNFLFHKSSILYNFHNAYNEARKKNQIYLFEGFMDVIASSRCGLKNAVATMGTALTQEHIKMMLSVTNNIVLCFDGDNAGINAMRRGAELLANYNIIPLSVVLPNGQDPDEYIKQYGNEKLYNYLTNEAKPVYSWLYKLAKDKLIKNDVISIENFKNEVFSFILSSKQSTIVEFYLKELSIDLEVDISSINNDYVKYSKTNFVSQYKEPINEEKKVQPKKHKVNNKVKNAYKVIIKHILNDYKCEKDYYRLTNNDFISKDFVVEYSILGQIHLIDNSNFIFNTPIDRTNYILNNLKANEQYAAYLEELENGKLLFNLDKNQEFIDCVDVIKQYLKR